MYQWIYKVHRIVASCSEDFEIIRKQYFHDIPNHFWIRSNYQEGRNGTFQKGTSKYQA